MRLLLAALLAGLPRPCAAAGAQVQAEALEEGSADAASAVYDGGTAPEDSGAVPLPPAGDHNPDGVHAPRPRPAARPVPPEPGADAPSAAGAQEPEEEKSWWDKLPKKQMAIGAAFGAVGFGVIGFALGGPAGMLLGAAAGAAFMAGVAYVNSL